MLKVSLLSTVLVVSSIMLSPARAAEESHAPSQLKARVDAKKALGAASEMVEAIANTLQSMKLRCMYDPKTKTEDFEAYTKVFSQVIKKVKPTEFCQGVGKSISMGIKQPSDIKTPKKPVQIMECNKILKANECP